jgi:hypothetical protein
MSILIARTEGESTRHGEEFPDVPDACPICGCRPTTITLNQGYVTMQCARCGEFALSSAAFDLPAHWIAGKQPHLPPQGRFAASHAIRRMQAPRVKRPEFGAARLRVLWVQPLPNPQRQADLLLLALDNVDFPLDEFVHWRVERFCDEAGTRDDPVPGRFGEFNLLTKRLSDRGLIDINHHAPAGTTGLRLTIEGWEIYERLRQAVVVSTTAFMAMSFNNPTVDRILAEHFILAVKEAGYDLYRMDSRPKSGLIDNRMKVEIRPAKFLVCDLTDENRGAYWESGFAEGALKPVFYTCERSKFDDAKTHFDTEHMFTVKWDAANPGPAAEELKAAIRNEFPADTVPPDLSKGYDASTIKRWHGV